uniref:Ubiquitin-like protease family profile domain-containing protein n=1 Tax=Cucumis melo TaxID=3656 RepID=A0A9I9E353_CUCME
MIYIFTIYCRYLYSLIIDLKKVSKYVFVDPSLISAGHSTREIRARNLCSRLMTSKQDQLVVAPYNPGDHWALVIINPYDDVVYHLNSLRTSSRDNIKYVTNMALTIFQSQKNLKKTRKTTFRKAVKVGTVECGYYIMRYMREIMSKDTSIITDAIDTRNSYSQLELDEVRVEWAEFLSRPQIGNFSWLYLDCNCVIVDDIVSSKWILDGGLVSSKRILDGVLGSRRRILYGF